MTVSWLVSIIMTMRLHHLTPLPNQVAKWKIVEEVSKLSG